MGAWLFVTGRTWHKLWHFICVASNNLTFCMLFLAVYLFLRSTLFEAWWRRGRDRCRGGSRAGEFLDPQSKHWHGEHWAIDLFALSDNPKCQTNNAIAEDSPTDWGKRERERDRAGRVGEQQPRVVLHAPRFRVEFGSPCGFLCNRMTCTEGSSTSWRAKSSYFTSLPAPLAVLYHCRTAALSWSVPLCPSVCPLHSLQQIVVCP